MRLIAVLLTAFCLNIAHAEPSAPLLKSETPEFKTPTEERRDLLNELFLRLKKSSTADEAEKIDEAIALIFRDTGSAAVNHLIERAENTLKNENTTQALEYMDSAIALMPRSAELYQRRAQLHYVLRDFGKALDDLRTALALEPRHTGALLGLGLIFSDINHEKEALHAYQKILEINPHQEDALKQVEALRRKVEGDGI